MDARKGVGRNLSFFYLYTLNTKNVFDVKIVYIVFVLV